MKRVLLAAPIFAVPFLLGCASSASRTDAAFGESVRQARAVQLIDPEAARKAKDPSGIDAQAARSSIDRYQESFRNPQSTFNVMGIGGTLGSQ